MSVRAGVKVDDLGGRQDRRVSGGKGLRPSLKIGEKKRQLHIQLYTLHTAQNAPFKV